MFFLNHTEDYRLELLEGLFTVVWPNAIGNNSNCGFMPMVILGSTDFGTKSRWLKYFLLRSDLFIYYLFIWCVCGGRGGDPYLCVSHHLHLSLTESDSVWSDPLNTKADSGGTSGQMKQVLMNKYNAKYTWSC